MSSTADLILITKPSASQAGTPYPNFSYLPLIKRQWCDTVAYIPKVQDLASYDKIIFVSTAAVSVGMGLIQEYAPPCHPQYLAIGSHTATSLAKYGITADYPSTQPSSESLLKLTQLANLAGEKILLFASHHGRQLLQTTLCARGAQVDVLAMYAIVPLSYTSQDLASLIDISQIGVLTATSGKILHCLINLINQCALPWLDLPIIVPSQRLQQLAYDQGFVQVAVSASASEADIMLCASSIG